MIFKHLTTVCGEYIFISGTLVTVNKGLAARYMIVDFFNDTKILELYTYVKNWWRKLAQVSP